MSLKRKWLRTLFLLMLAVTSFGGPMNPKEIEALLLALNKTQVELTLPVDGTKGDGHNVPKIDVK